MMRRPTVLACLCALPALVGLAKAAIAPATGGEAIAESAFVVPGETTTGRAPPSEPVTPPAAVTPVPSGGPAPTSANPLWAIPLSSLTATRERPLFSASRRPPPPVMAPVPIVRAAPPPPPPAEPEKPGLALVGTVLGGPDSFGIFIDETSRISMRLRVGDQHDGWTLRSVQKREATLEKDQQIEVVEMPQPGRGGDDGNDVLPPNPERDIVDGPPPQLIPSPAPRTPRQRAR